MLNRTGWISFRVPVLPAPVRAEEPVRLAAGDGEADAVDGLAIAEPLAQARALEDERTRGRDRSRCRTVRLERTIGGR